MSEKPIEYFHKVRVYIEDTDAGGIVFYVNYLKYMERARTEMFRHLGFGKAASYSDNAMFVVRKVNAHYHRPALLDDELRVSASISKLRKASLILTQNIYRDDELLVSSSVEVASVEKTQQKPVAIPKPMYEALLAFS